MLRKSWNVQLPTKIFYLQKMLKWNTVNVCLKIINFITINKS